MRRGDRGSAVLEMVVLLPVYMAFVMAVVVVGKLNNSSANIEAAARSAARTISLAGTPENALDDAEDLAGRMAGEGTAFCDGEMGFDAAFEGDPEEGELVTVTLECDVDLAQATFLDTPGTQRMTATATELIDPLRERRP